MLKKYVIGISFVLLLSLVIRRFLVEDSIKRNFKITPALIQDINSGYRGGLQMKYSFTYNNKKYKGGTKAFISSSFEEKFRNKRIPVAFDSVQPSNNNLLLLPYDFDKYGLPFPDTLKWILDLKNRSL